MGFSQKNFDSILLWLTRLRYGAAGVCGAFGIFFFFTEGIYQSVTLTFLIASAVTLLSNFWLQKKLVKKLEAKEIEIGAILLLDVLLLTAVLFVTGAAMNPFTVIYLVHISLAATLLNKKWTLLTAFSSIACYASLFVPLSLSSHQHHHLHDYSFHLHGMWVAFVVTAIMVTFFLHKILTDLHRQSEQIKEMAVLAANNERFAALAQLSAGAAHELGTPLGTISLIARELEIRLSKQADKETLGDLHLIKNETERCRMVLDQMAGKVDPRGGEELAFIDCEALLRELVNSYPEELRRKIKIVKKIENGESAQTYLDKAGLLQALKNILDNALQATGCTEVTVSVLLKDEQVIFEIKDNGSGMSEDVLNRIGEPFFTLKSSGKGMGLGVFLTKLFVKRWDGMLLVNSKEHAGTEVQIVLPLCADHVKSNHPSNYSSNYSRAGNEY